MCASLPKTEEKDPQPGQGKVVLRTQGIRQMQWLADGRRLLVLHHPDGGKGNVVRVDRVSGEVTRASPGDLDVEAFAATPDGRRLALLVSVPDQDAGRPVCVASGGGDHGRRFLAGRRCARRREEEADAHGCCGGGRGRRRVDRVRRQTLCGTDAARHFGQWAVRDLSGLRRGAAVPRRLQHDPAFRQWPDRGFVVPQSELAPAEAPEPFVPRQGPALPRGPCSGLPSTPDVSATIYGA